jgi:hypothetical protein
MTLRRYSPPDGIRAFPICQKTLLAANTRRPGTVPYQWCAIHTELTLTTVGYVRSLNIDLLSVWCNGKRAGGFRCNHQADLDLTPYTDELPCSVIESRLVCTHCDAIGAVDAWPNWSELNGAGGCAQGAVGFSPRG